MAATDPAELPDGTRVVQSGYGRTGTVVRYETAYRTRWVVVHWDGAQFTDRAYPTAVEPIGDDPR